MTELHAVETTDTQSWDDFVAERRRARGPARTEVICGVEVLVPTDITLDFEDRLTAAQDDDSEETLEEIVSELFGEGALSAWRAQGMTRDEFEIVFIWGYHHASKKPISFSEAADLQEQQGKALPNRAARRAAARPRSASTSGRSKRTSNGSTASTRKRSGA